MSPAETGAEAKICEFDVSVMANQNVVWFNITMDEAHGVHALHGANQFGYVKSEKQYSFNQVLKTGLNLKAITLLVAPQKSLS